ncbi:hypothetical protein [Caudoviricetes sp.]|nr:MAG: hypothetical protein [Podoviridae sp. ct2cs2]UOF77566.1 hypothetical protein [Caudoviricetes sp.]
MAKSTYRRADGTRWWLTFIVNSCGFCMCCMHHK